MRNECGKEWRNLIVTIGLTLVLGHALTGCASAPDKPAAQPEPAQVDSVSEDLGDDADVEPYKPRTPQGDKPEEWQPPSVDEPPTGDVYAFRRWCGERVKLGDGRLVAGDLDAAREAWISVVRAARKLGRARPPQSVRDARVRLAYVGKPPPKIGDAQGLGGDAETWKSLRGKLVIAHSFWAACVPCRSSMLSLDALARKHGDRVVVLGLGGFVPRGQDGGRLPESRESIHSPVHFVEIPDADAFRQHLIEFRRVVELTYPWLVQQTPDYIGWQYPENHPILLIGRDGKIKMAVRGPDLEPLEAVLGRELGSD